MHIKDIVQKQGEDPSKIDPNSIKGWDFVNNDADPMETTYKDWQNSGGYPEIYEGSAYYTSHGTHVAGTIAADKRIMLITRLRELLQM